MQHRASRHGRIWSIVGAGAGRATVLAADLDAADAFGLAQPALHAVDGAAVGHDPARQAGSPLEEGGDRDHGGSAGDAANGALAEPVAEPVANVARVAGWMEPDGIQAVAARVERWRHTGPVTTVLEIGAATTAAEPLSQRTARALREHLIARSDVLVGTIRDAWQLLGAATDGDTAADGLADAAGIDGLGRLQPDATLAAAPQLARRLRALGAGAVCLVDEPERVPQPTAPVAAPRADEIGVRTAPPRVWLASAHASGWLTAARSARDTAVTAIAGGAPAPAPHDIAFTTAFASALAAALARGFVAADAAVLAMMAGTAGTCPDGHRTTPSFIDDPGCLPDLSWGEALEPIPGAGPTRNSRPRRRLDLYAIVDRADRIPAVLQAGVQTVQLRIKTPPSPDAHWLCTLAEEVRQGIEACAAGGAELFINDHWRLARDLGADGVHLGQEDLLALGEAGRAELAASGLALGVSSHSLWELCRTRQLHSRYVACGPVWPTLTKAMPWQAQGLDNLAWWCRMAPAPVVAIGGILEPDQARAAARTGVDGLCIVRAIGTDPGSTVPRFRAALEAGRADPLARFAEAAWPHPSLHRRPVPTSSA